MTANPPNLSIYATLSTLNLSDPEEERAHGWVERFFDDKGAHRLVDIARARHPSDCPDLIMLGTYAPNRPDAVTSWTVFRYQIRAISVQWRTYATAAEARAAFRNAIAVPTWPRLMTAADVQAAP